MTRRATAVNDPVYPPVDDDRELTIDERRKEALDGLAQIGQYICLGFGNFRDAGAIGRHADGITRETVKLANENKQVASKVDLLIQIGPYTGLIAAGIPFVLQLLVNHGVFPAEKMANAGVVTPESLEYEMKTALMKQQMEAMREQQRVEEEMQRMHDEMMANANANGHPVNDTESNDQ